MKGTRKPVVITDLDGTLLDHQTYAWQPAREALEALHEAGIPLILNSSKTRAEISALRVELGNEYPYIVENGAAVVIPPGYFEPGPERLMAFSEPRAVILEVLEELRLQGFRFCNFDAMSAPQLASMSGLSVEAAALAKQRDATEPLQWQDDELALQAFEEALAQRQLRLVRGGRFYHVMGFFDKADAMQYLLEQYRALYRGEAIVSIALGDSPNDLRMLEQADIAVVIKGENPTMTLSGHPWLIRPDKPGPAGWNDAVLELLKKL